MGFHSLRLIVFLFTFCFNVELVLSTCYNPDGSEQDGPAYEPCVQTVGTISMCCGTNWTATDPRIEDDKCEANGLCLNNNPSDNQPLYWRGSCTDPTWKSPNCLSNLCTSSSSGGDPTNNVALIQCTDGSWCCGGSNTTCCAEGLGVKIAATIGAAKQSVSTPTPSKIIASPVSTSIPTSISSLGSTSTSGSIPGSGSVSTSISTGSTSVSASGSTLITTSSSSSTATNFLAASPSGSSSNSSSDPSKSAEHTQAGLSVGTMAGLGVVIGVLVVAIMAGIIWFIFWRKKKQVMMQKPASELSSSSGYGTPQELPISGKTAYAEMGSRQPEHFQYEVDGNAPLPVVELSSSRFR